ncbi:Centromere protein I [Holothuria leucospilota]|uniref:Centromere protein I n=1 Tax=Holothuria leucospilota TaxID=206669 RepID=A0A9Q1H0N5_HOLLE|nr:Centromere protein I [Holothuria leucospilota]
MSQSTSGKKKRTQQEAESHQDANLDEQIDYFTSENSNKKNRNHVELSLALSKVESVAKEQGLTSEQLITLLDVSASGKFPVSTSSKLIKCLLPSRYIPEEAAIKCTSWICSGTPARELQVFLLKWMVLTFELLGRSEKLHALYGVIFNFIENDSLCPHACHLLYKLTRKDDVLPFRVNRLLKLQKKVGSQSYIIGLLSLYKVYQPHLVVLSVPASKRIFFRVIERNWMVEIRKARERSLPEEGRTGATLHTVNQNTGVTQISKKRKRDVIPSAVTAAVTGERLTDLSLVGSQLSSIPSEQIKSFEELLNSVDRLELPGQIASVLKSVVLQHAVACYQEDQISQRLGFWLYETLHEEILDQPFSSNKARGERCLKLVINFTEFLQEGIPACENFLVRYLHTWNGSDYRPYILRLISRFRLYDFPKLNDLILEPLRKLFFCSSVFCKCQMIHTFTMMLKNFVTVEIPRYQAERGKGEGSQTSSEGDKFNISMFTISQEEFDFYGTVEKFIQFVDKLITVAVMAESDHALLFHYLLTFYELVSELRCKYNTPFVCIPSAGIVYRALLSSNCVQISRMCNIVCSYRREFSSWKEASKTADVWQGTRDLIAPFNQYILDFSNILWRNKAFKKDQVVHEPFLSVIPSEVIDRTKVDGPNDGLSVLRHIALVGYAYQFLKETQPKNKKLHPNLIQPKNRDLYLEFLQRHRLEGVLAFINTYIKRTSTKR